MHGLGINVDFICSYEGTDFERAVRIISNTGYDGVMMYLDENFVHKRLEQIANLLKDEGLKVFQVHPPWPCLASCDSRERDKALDTYKRWIDYSHRLNAETMIVHPSGEEQPPNRKQALDLTVEGLSRLAKEAAPLTLALENVAPSVKVSQPIGATAEELIWIIEQIDSQNLGICLDTSHCLASGIDLISFIQGAGKYIVTTHLHDTELISEKGIIKDQHLPLGEGVIDWKKCLNSLKENSPEASWVLELDPKDRKGNLIPMKRREKIIGEAFNFLKENG